MALKHVLTCAALFCFSQFSFFGTAAYAADPAVTKLSAIVETVSIDSSLAGSRPAFFSAETLTRELETALEATGLFTVPTRNRAEIEPLIAELKRAGGHSLKFTKARFIMEPVVTSITLDMRTRDAPHMQTKVLRSVTGHASLFVTVIDTRDGSVSKRLPIEVRYATPERLDDPRPGDTANADYAQHSQAGAGDFVALSQTIGRAFAKRVLDQVSPVFVAQRDGDRVFLTRGEDAGYHIGEVLRVIHRGGAIIHPVTHEVLGYDEREVAQVEVVEVLPKLSIARITQGSGSPASGDIVREPVESGGN